MDALNLEYTKTKIDSKEAQELTAKGVSHKEALGHLKHILLILLQLTNEERNSKETFSCWDWDVIYDYIEQDKPGSIYAFALNYAVSTSDSSRLETPSSQNKFVMLDGTRDEILNYLNEQAQLLRFVRVYKESPNQSEEYGVQHKGVFRHTSWRIIENKLKNLSSDQNIARLETLLERHAKSLEDFGDVEFANVSLAKVRESDSYCEAIDLLSPRTGQRRNKADAQNIAHVALAQQDHYSARLVTNTGVLLKNFKKESIDPFIALLYQNIQSRIRDPEIREKRIEVWLTHILSLLHETDAWTQAMQRRASIPKHTIKYFHEAIAAYRKDDALEDLIEILSRTMVAALNRREECLENNDKLRGFDNLIRDLPCTDLRRIENRVSHALNRYLKDKVPDEFSSSYRWVHNREKSGYEYWELLRRQPPSGEILTLERTPRNYSIHWPVALSFINLIKLIEYVLNKRQIAKNRNLINIEVLYPRGEVLRWSAEVGSRDKWDLLAGHKSHSKLTYVRARIVMDLGSIFYEPGSVDLALISRVAVVSNDESLRWVLKLFDETSPEFINQNMLSKVIKQKLKSYVRS